jgi:hypothetical protein
MPQIVEAFIRQPGSLEQRLERTDRKVAGINRSPDRGGEYEPVVLPQSGESRGLFKLAVVMASESVYSPTGESYLSAALGGFRGRKLGAIFSQSQRPANVQRACFEVYVFPAKP